MKNRCKKLCARRKGLSGFDEILIGGSETPEPDQIRAALAKATPQRILYIAKPIRPGLSWKMFIRLQNLTLGIWDGLPILSRLKKSVKDNGLPINGEGWMKLKAWDFLMPACLKLVGVKEEAVTRARYKHNIHPVFKRVDSCAAEIPSDTPLYVFNV